MRSTAIVLALVAGYAVTGHPVRAVVVARVTHTVEWTEARILATRPMPAQVARPSLEERRQPLAGAAPTRSRGAPASAPRLRPRNDRALSLADPARLAAAWSRGEGADRRQAGEPVARPLNRGAANFDFTSSRLVPEDAVTAYPYSTTGILLLRNGGRSYYCSASVVAKRLVATAGHCVYTASSGFSTDLLFVPAFHDGLAPFGAWEGVEVFVTDEWVVSPRVLNAADFGIVVLADSDGLKVGDVTGWLGYRTNALNNNHVKMLGYPQNHDRGTRMHQVDSGDWALADPVCVWYGSDMRGGSSGGPWVQNFGVRSKGQRGGKNRLENRLVGVVSAGFKQSKWKIQASSIPGTGFEELFDQACAQAAGNCAKKGKPGSRTDR